MLKAGFHLKDVLTSLNMAFVPISCSRVRQRQIPLLKTLTNVLRFCVHFWVIFGHFGKEIIFLKDVRAQNFPRTDFFLNFDCR